MAGALRAAAVPVMRLAIDNQSGYADDQVFFMMVCASPPGYLDFRTHVLVATPSFALDVSRMAASLMQIRAYSGDGTCTIPCPAMGSSRLYFCLGRNFDRMGGFPLSGPEMGHANPVPYAKFEVDLSRGGFINSTEVDFFSIAYTLTATRTTGERVTVGITNASDIIFREFEAIPPPATPAQAYGNPDIFKACLVRDAAGHIVRVLSPKVMGLQQAGVPEALPQQFSHFLDAYVNTHCWRPGRTFSFSSKRASDPARYYGRVSADGLTLSLYTDAAMTRPYAVPTLPRPSNALGNPDFNAHPGYWHNAGAASTAPNALDWGYILYGQDGYPAGPGAHWITDPVAMAIPVSIVRGVMHLDNGAVDWKNPAKYYQGLNGAGTAAFPIFHYGRILHRNGLAGHVYALSYDDVYGADPGIGFSDPAVTLRLYPFRSQAPGTTRAGAGDYDGDRKADPVVAVNGAWTIWSSAAGYRPLGPLHFTAAGASPLMGDSDFDGDRLADPAMVAGDAWQVWLSSAGYTQAGPLIFAGPPAAHPLAADFDGDRRADPAVAADGAWYVWPSGSGYARLGPFAFAAGGGAHPLAADFDGDGKADPAMAVSGAWHVWLSSAGYRRAGPFGFAAAGASPTPLAADFDGDRKADPAIEANRHWTVWLSSAGYARTGSIPLQEGQPERIVF